MEKVQVLKSKIDKLQDSKLKGKLLEDLKAKYNSKDVKK